MVRRNLHGGGGGVMTFNTGGLKDAGEEGLAVA